MIKLKNAQLIRGQNDSAQTEPLGFLPSLQKEFIKVDEPIIDINIDEQVSGVD